jgi:hypothetical protein
MALKNFAIYELSTGLIENVIYLDDEHIADLIGFPAEGFGYVELPTVSGEWSTCGIGWSYIDNQFIEPPEPKKVIPDNQPVVQGVQTL